MLQNRCRRECGIDNVIVNAPTYKQGRFVLEACGRSGIRNTGNRASIGCCKVHLLEILANPVNFEPVNCVSRNFKIQYMQSSVHETRDPATLSLLSGMRKQDSLKTRNTRDTRVQECVKPQTIS